MTSTKRAEVTALTKAKAAAKRKLIEANPAQYDELVLEEMKGQGYRCETRTFTEWVPSRSNGTN